MLRWQAVFIAGIRVQCHGHANPSQHTTGWMHILRGSRPQSPEDDRDHADGGSGASSTAQYVLNLVLAEGWDPVPCHPLCSYMCGLGSGPRRANPYFEIGTARISKNQHINTYIC